MALLANQKSITLRDLADLAIGTPEVGAVNFNALHTLLLAMLNNMNLQDMSVDLPPPSSRPSTTVVLPKPGPDTPSGVQHLAEPKKHRISHSGRKSTFFVEAQVKDLDGQIRALENNIQDIVAHMQQYGIPMPMPRGLSPLDTRLAEGQKPKLLRKAKDWDEATGVSPSQGGSGVLPTSPSEHGGATEPCCSCRPRNCQWQVRRPS